MYVNVATAMTVFQHMSSVTLDVLAAAIRWMRKTGAQTVVRRKTGHA